MNQVISYPNIHFDPATNKLTLTLLGKVLEAKVLPRALAVSKFALPVLVSQLLEPLKKQLSDRWESVDAEEEIEAITADEEVVHEVMALAFWWATASYNNLDNVRLVHFQELSRLANDCLKLQAEKSEGTPALILGPGVMTLPGGATTKVRYMIVESVSAA